MFVATNCVLRRMCTFNVDIRPNTPRAASSTSGSADQDTARAVIAEAVGEVFYGECALKTATFAGIA